MFKANSYINGEPVGEGLETLKLFSALNKELIGTIPILTEKELREIFESSREAYSRWKFVDHSTREKFMLQYASKLKEYTRMLTQLVTLEVGKSEKEAKKEIERSIEYIVESVHAFERFKDPRSYSVEKYPLMSDTLEALYFRAPRGVVLLVCPFNYPVNTVITKLVPAILTGNVVVLKCSTRGSLCGWLLSKIFNELTVEKNLVTPGVLNYYTGSGVVLLRYITEHKPELSALSFTGSREVGLQYSKALPGIAQSLELSALNAGIVLEDAELEKSVQKILSGAFSLSGQRCTSLQLICVHHSTYEAFNLLLKSKIQTFEGERMPLSSEAEVVKIKEVYEKSLSLGAKLLSSEVKWETLSGSLVPNIILVDLSWESILAKEECFGPILGVIKFENVEEAVKRLNSIGYGLQASIFSKDLKKAAEIGLNIEVGRVNLNLEPARSPDILPFPSSRKSGNSEQGIVNSLYFFTTYRGIVFNKEE